MRAFILPKNRIDSQPNVQESVQRKATTTFVDNRPTAVRQRAIQQAATTQQKTAQPKLIQRVANSYNRSVQIGNSSVAQRMVIEGSTKYTGAQIYKRHQATFDQADVSEDDLTDCIDDYEDITLADLFKKFKINPSRRRDKEDKKDTTFRGKRTIGDSNRLAQNRYSLKPKKHSFKPWRKNREAQHIIPATIAKTYPILESIIDEAENGIMLPATYQAGNKKLTHRRPKYRDHPTYTKNVRNLIKKILKDTKLKNNQTTMRMIMRSLRPVNKLVKYQYIDKIPSSEYTQSWNNMNAAHKI